MDALYTTAPVSAHWPVSDGPELTSHLVLTSSLRTLPLTSPVTLTQSTAVAAHWCWLVLSTAVLLSGMVTLTGQSSPSLDQINQTIMCINFIAAEHCKHLTSI